MDELDHNLLAAWHRVFERCRKDPVEARRRYERMHAGGVYDRPVRAWCVAIRASDSRLDELVTYLSGGLLYGREVEKPSDFEFERRRKRVPRAKQGGRLERGRPAAASAG